MIGEGHNLQDISKIVRHSIQTMMKFYERFGFKEDPDVHLDWCMFDDIPYPTMRLSLE